MGQKDIFNYGNLMHVKGVMLLPVRMEPSVQVRLPRKILTMGKSFTHEDFDFMCLKKIKPIFPLLLFLINRERQGRLKKKKKCLLPADYIGDTRHLCMQSTFCWIPNPKYNNPELKASSKMDR